MKRMPARALITGASRGIGRALAIAMARKGIHVVLTATSFEPLDSLLAVIQAQGGEGSIIVADLLMRSERQRLAEKAGPIDILVNNAGVLGGRERLYDTSLTTFETTLELNAVAPFDLIRLLVPGMVGRGSGTIVNVSSSVALKGRGTWGAYSTSKAALEGMSQSLSDELEGSGVRCVTVNPGGTRTDMRAEALPDEDPTTLPTAELIAQPIVELIACEDDRHHGKRYNLRELAGIA
jgi:short-subunit dehydrogenase